MASDKSGSAGYECVFHNLKCDLQAALCRQTKKNCIDFEMIRISNELLILPIAQSMQFLFS